MYTLIKKYKLGICYEEAQREISTAELEEYLLRQYEEWSKERLILYEPDDSVFHDFSYEGIANDIEDIVRNVIAEDVNND